jgi:hypothetical protein
MRNHTVHVAIMATISFALTAPPPFICRSAQGIEPGGVVRETFNADVGWDGFRNRLLPKDIAPVHQDFGYRRSNRAHGQRPGEIGGIIQRADRRAYYAKPIAPATLHEKLSASGRLAVTQANSSSGALVGWFSDATSQGWRTPNSLAMRIDGNGAKFWIFFEYGTQSRSTGGAGAFEGEQYQTTPTQPFAADGTAHDWQLSYDPSGAAGQGLIVFQIDDRRYEFALLPGHKVDNASFDRFGIWNQQTSGESLELYLDDLVLNGEQLNFDIDPVWISEGNPANYPPRLVRPYHDFGFRLTSHAGGAIGEIGGIVFRDEQPMYYADRAGPYSLNDRLHASGKLVMLGAGADSAVNIGWFNSSSKRAKTTSELQSPQTDYVGVMIEGPSRVGHYFRAAYSTSAGTHDAPTGEGTPQERPIVQPAATAHQWSIDYDPNGASGNGRIVVGWDKTRHVLELTSAARAEGATLDRFGVFNLQAGGHHVELYLDDIAYSKTK